MVCISLRIRSSVGIRTSSRDQWSTTVNTRVRLPMVRSELLSVERVFPTSCCAHGASVTSLDLVSGRSATGATPKGEMGWCRSDWAGIPLRLTVIVVVGAGASWVERLGQFNNERLGGSHEPWMDLAWNA